MALKGEDPEINVDGTRVAFGSAHMATGDESAEQFSGEVTLQTCGAQPMREGWASVGFSFDASDCNLDELREASAGPVEVKYGGHSFESVAIHNKLIDEVDRDECDDHTVALVEILGGVTLELAEMEDDDA